MTEDQAVQVLQDHVKSLREMGADASSERYQQMVNEQADAIEFALTYITACPESRGFDDDGTPGPCSIVDGACYMCGAEG